MIITSVSSAVTILSFLTGSVLYRFRWKLRYLYYSARRSNKIHHGNDVVYEYDAFISYSDDARLFVDHTMRLEVEENAGLKLCLHNRDFLPSLPIAEGIIIAVKSSRKTILVMSPDFIISYWCLYEMNMADMESQHTGRDVLLILFYKHIKYDKIPSTVMYQIKSHTYIEYPDEDSDSDAMVTFWDNFSRAITS
ncbi:toll-like receptor 4 [Patella vulgata]|uniref:toll-like receptor 4 n=1 Tax=Patella vulgata TaxID=6465 RepID=UPI0024A89887|nr:toll-like receptor 4 [Patella vulgata]